MKFKTKIPGIGTRFSRFQFRDFLCSCHLPFLHPLPADEAIEVIDQKHHKANDHGQIADMDIAKVFGKTVEEVFAFESDDIDE